MVKFLFPYCIDQSVFIDNPAAPTTGKIAFQRLQLYKGTIMANLGFGQTSGNEILAKGNAVLVS
jgi:hypothetical protein